MLEPTHSRSRRQAVGRAALAAVVLGTLAACGGPSDVPLSDLVTEHESYQGEQIVVRGVVIDVDEEGVRRHAVLQDQDGNRLEVAPFEAAEPHVGSIVEVTGEFEFDPDRGRVVHAESVEPIGG